MIPWADRIQHFLHSHLDVGILCSVTLRVPRRVAWLRYAAYMAIWRTIQPALNIGRMLQFHSHQIFHCFVMAGAFVHYHGISQMAIYRLQHGECPVSSVDLGCIRNVTSSAMASAAAMME